MNRLTVISKNINKREINMVIVHSFADAHREALDAMERGCDEAVVEDEVHNVVLRLKKPKKTNFDRITASPEALAKWLEESIGSFCETYNGEVDCDKCPIADDCDVIEQKRLKQLRDNSTDNISISDKDYWLAWLKQESNDGR